MLVIKFCDLFLLHIIEAVKCLKTEFQCATGKCIPAEWKCDEDLDCHSLFDLSDEENCYDCKFCLIRTV